MTMRQPRRSVRLVKIVHLAVGGDMAAQEPVLVGIDGSSSARTAAGWAGREAELRKAGVHFVMVNDGSTTDDELRSTLTGITQDFRQVHPDIAIQETITRGHPAQELLRQSAQAQLLVVGSRGRSAFKAALLGSVSARVAMHAQCPVVVARAYTTDGPVVVGLDDSQNSRAALQFALDAGTARGVDVVAVQAWQVAGAEFSVVPPLDIELQDSRQTARRILADQTAGWDEHYPSVTLRRRTQRGHPVEVLADAAIGAQLLVVGHRGRGGFPGMLLGSVASGVLHHAQCPVAVIRKRS